MICRTCSGTYAAQAPGVPIPSPAAMQAIFPTWNDPDTWNFNAFNANITKAAVRFLDSKSGKNVDIEAIGRKGRDFMRRRYPAAKVQTRSLADLTESVEVEPESSERAGTTQITGEHVGILGKVEFSQARALAENVIGRYTREEIDAYAAALAVAVA